MGARNNKKLNIIVAILLIIALLFTQGCKKKEVVAPEPTLPVAETITYTTYNQFALDLLRNSRNSKENIMISPIAIGIIMTLLRMGAEGETGKSIENVLGMTIPDFNLATTQSAEVVKYINELKGFDTGSAMFIDEGPTVREDYAVNVEDNFNMQFK
jgi:serine protease inhibitor